MCVTKKEGGRLIPKGPSRADMHDLAGNGKPREAPCCYVKVREGNNECRPRSELASSFESMTQPSGVMFVPTGR